MTTRRMLTVPLGFAWLLACGPGKSTMTTMEETGAADGSWGSGSTGGGATSGASSGGPSSASAGSSGCTADGCAGTSQGGSSGAGSDLPPSGGACDAWAQDCPEGQKCSFYGMDGGPHWNAPLCAPLPDDPAGHGEPCTVDLQAGNDTCDRGHVCWDVDPDTQTGTCRALCTGSIDEPSCPPAMHCILARTWNFCELDCHPLAQDCGAESVCAPAPDDMDHFYCLPDGSGAEGQAFDGCGGPGGCDPGLLCGDPKAVSPTCDAMAAGCCTPFCDTDKPDCPDKQQTCAPYFEPGVAAPGFETLGVCRL